MQSRRYYWFPGIYQVLAQSDPPVAQKTRLGQLVAVGRAAHGSEGGFSYYDFYLLERECH